MLLSGALGIAWYFAWMIVVTETPSKYENISQEELEYITHSIGFTEAQTKASVLTNKENC